MDPLASEDTNNAPGAVSDELIQAENEAIEQEQREEQEESNNGIYHASRPLVPSAHCNKTDSLV